MTIPSILLLAIVASSVTLTVVALFEAGLLLAHAMVKRYRQLTAADCSDSGQVTEAG